MLEENENHAHQSQTFITTTVRNNYNGIGISSEINSCYRKVTIFYLNSTATRITWQQHTSVETMLVFDEENTLAPEVMDGHLNSILKGTEMYLNLFPSLWLQKGSQLLSPSGGRGSKLILHPLLQGWVCRARVNTEVEARAGWASFVRKEAKMKGFPVLSWKLLK